MLGYFSRCVKSQTILLIGLSVTLLLMFVQMPKLLASAMRNIGAISITNNQSTESLTNARMWLQRSLSLQSAPQTYRLMGTTYQLEGNIAAAVDIWQATDLTSHVIATFLNALPATPNRAEWERQVIPLISTGIDWARLGNTYQKLSENQAAVMAYKNALQNVPTLKPFNTADINYNLGTIYQFQLNEPEQALKAYEKAKAIGSFQNDWHEFNTYLQIASLLLGKDNKTAFYAAQIAVQLKPENDLAHTVLGLTTYSATGDLDAAEHEMDIATQLSPSSLWPWLHRAQLYMNAEQYDAASDAYRHVLILDPENIFASEMIDYIQQTFLQKDAMP